jgi:hypothetical protein
VVSILGQIYKKIESLEPTVTPKTSAFAINRSGQYDKKKDSEVSMHKSPENNPNKENLPDNRSALRDLQVTETTATGGKSTKTLGLKLEMINAGQFKPHTDSISSVEHSDSEDDNIVTFRDREQIQSATTSVALGRKPVKEKQPIMVNCDCRAYMESKFEGRFFDKFATITHSIHKCSLTYINLIGTIFKKFNYNNKSISDFARNHLIEMKDRYAKSYTIIKSGYHEDSLDILAKLASATISDSGNIS